MRGAIYQLFPVHLVCRVWQCILVALLFSFWFQCWRLWLSTSKLLQFQCSPDNCCYHSFRIFFLVSSFSGENRDQTLLHNSVDVLDFPGSSANSLVSHGKSFILEIHSTNNFFLSTGQHMKAHAHLEMSCLLLNQFQSSQGKLNSQFNLPFSCINVEGFNSVCKQNCCHCSDFFSPTLYICVLHCRGSRLALAVSHRSLLMVAVVHRYIETKRKSFLLWALLEIFNVFAGWLRRCR